MRVVERPQIVRLGRVGRANLARLDLELSLAQASALDENLVYIASSACCAFSSKRVARHLHAGVLSSSSCGLRPSGSCLSAIVITSVYLCLVSMRVASVKESRCGTRAAGLESCVGRRANVQHFSFEPILMGVSLDPHATTMESM